MTKRGNSERKRRARELAGQGLSHAQALGAVDRARRGPSRLHHYVSAPGDAAMTAIELLANAACPVPDELSAELLSCARFQADLVETWETRWSPARGVRIDLDCVTFTLADRSIRPLWVVTEASSPGGPGSGGEAAVYTFPTERRALTAWRRTRASWRETTRNASARAARASAWAPPRAVRPARP